MHYLVEGEVYTGRIVYKEKSKGYDKIVTF